MAPLRYASKFDPFLSSDRAPTPSTLAQSKEGIKFCHLATLMQKPEPVAVEQERGGGQGDGVVRLVLGVPDGRSVVGCVCNCTVTFA